MVSKLIVAIICVVVLLGLGVRGFFNLGTNQRDTVKWAEKNSLKEIARRTKEEGKTKVNVPAPIFEYPGVNSTLDEALRDSSLVVAKLIERQSYPFSSDGVRTWNKFKVVDALSENFSACSTCPVAPEPPQELSQINSDEFLLPTGGGTVDVDGVEVTVENSSIPAFEIGKKYVLVITLTPSRVALLGAGPSGIFGIADDDKLKPVNNHNHPMQTEIGQRFGSLSKLKSHVKN